MHIGLLNPQGNFDPNDSYWTAHPDFGGQLVYVKEIALALAKLGHRVDILTRQIVDEAWPEFAAALDAYPGTKGVRIVRIPCGPKTFLPKEQLWPHLGTEWVHGIEAFYDDQGAWPDCFSGHYADGGLAGAVLQQQTGIPFTFTGHSLGAQKMERFHVTRKNLAQLDERFLFRRRLMAERVSMSHAACVITSTRQEQQQQYGHKAYAGTNVQRFAVIPPGVNRAVFSPAPDALDDTVSGRIERAVLRDISSQRQRLPLVLCSSRLDRKKNHLGLVKAFAASDSLRAKANLALVVRGLENPLQQRHTLPEEERTILDDIAATLDRHDLCQAVTSFSLDSQLELAAAYRVCAAQKSVFALTALYEPFGLAPLEAMSCGLPAVVTQNGGPCESMLDEAAQKEFGVLVDPENPLSIAAGLLKALDSNAWQAYHHAGMQRVETRYTWNSTAKGYLEIFGQMASWQPKAPPDIPDYFLHPGPDNDIAQEDLATLYF